MAQHISIGIESSPAVALRVSDDELQKLQKALGSDGWHDVEGEDGTLRVKLKMVTWVKVEKDDSRVGFGIG